MEDLFVEFIGYDLTMGADVIKCSHCGKKVPYSVLFDEDEIDCPECGKVIKKKQG